MAVCKGEVVPGTVVVWWRVVAGSTRVVKEVGPDTFVLEDASGPLIKNTVVLARGVFEDGKVRGIGVVDQPGYALTQVAGATLMKPVGRFDPDAANLGRLLESMAAAVVDSDTEDDEPPDEPRVLAEERVDAHAAQTTYGSCAVVAGGGSPVWGGTAQPAATAEGNFMHLKEASVAG